MVRWDRSQTICSGAAWDARLLAYGASPWTVRLMRFMDPPTVVARRRANYARLASLLRDHVACPFPDLPEGVCPLFLPILVPDKLRFKQSLERLGVQSGNWWDDAHPTCPPVLADEVAGWRRQCLELPIHQELSGTHVDRVANAVLSVLAQQD
jgi:dTDP-4-amino-4,6-dideoxygalactose transaminase